MKSGAADFGRAVAIHDLRFGGAWFFIVLRVRVCAHARVVSE